MHSSKRVLAGVAAVALGAGVLTFVGAQSASADVAATSVATTPIRVSYPPGGTAGVTTPIQVPQAALAFVTPITLPQGSTAATLSLLAAPSGSAALFIENVTGGTAVDDTLGGPSSATIAAGTFLDDTYAAGDVVSIPIYLGPNDPNTVPGYYGFQVTLTGAADTVTVSGGFTTTGAPTSMSLTPGYATTTRNTPVTVTLSLTDAAGNVTQPANDDKVLWESTPAGLSLPGLNPVVASSMPYGEYEFATSSADQGTYALTATPLGIMPSSGVRPQTSYVLVSGTVSDDTVVAQAVVVPAAARNTNPPLVTDAAVPSGTSAITVGFRTLTGNSTVRYAVWSEAGSVNGAAARDLATAQFIDTTVGGNGGGSVSFTLAGAALSPFNVISVQQVNGSNGAVGPVMQITQVPNFAGAGAVVMPQGNLVAALGAKTPVNVVVVDFYGTPSAGTSVFAYRGTYASAPIATAKTGANGIATVDVTNAASAVNGSTEVYKFQIQTPDGEIGNLVGQDLIVRYTTTGAINSLVAVTTPTTVTAGGKLTQVPVVTVPDDGFVEDQSTAYVNPQTGAFGGLPGEYFLVTPLASPGTNLVITAPEGVKLVSPLLDGEPSGFNPILWSGGSSTVVVPNGTPVAVFATKTGEHSLTVTPYGATTPTATVPFVTVNTPNDAYTLTAEPTKITVDNVSFQNFKVSVKDVFGNPVPLAYVAATSAGDVLLSGLQDGNWLRMGADGTATATVIALRNAGAGVITLVGDPEEWDVLQPGYQAPPGAPTQPVSKATVEVKIEAKADASITIVGERAKVGGKPAVRVDGGSTGFVTGTEMTPMVRFPGQGEYTAGSARPKTNAAGDFEWSRKTGKKTYVYFMSGQVTSNRIIIAAK